MRRCQLGISHYLPSAVVVLSPEGKIPRIPSHPMPRRAGSVPENMERRHIDIRHELCVDLKSFWKEGPTRMESLKTPRAQPMLE